jgi:hypothetical protein
VKISPASSAMPAVKQIFRIMIALRIFFRAFN